MGMIEADDLERPRTGGPNGPEMIGGIDHEAGRGIGGDVARADRLDNRILTAQQQPAAFVRRSFPRVGDDGVVTVKRECHPRAFITNSEFQIHNSTFSTAMAIPMPPPMHSEATP